MAKVNVDTLPDLNGMLPLSTFTVMVKEIKQEPSKKTNAPMDELVLVILHPNEVNGVAAAGREAKLYIVYSLKNLKNAKTALSTLGVSGIPWTEVDLPSEEEVRSESRTRCSDIQDLTKGLEGMKFEVRLQTEPLYKTDTGTYSGKRLLDDAGQPIITGHKLKMANTSDILSAARPMSEADPY